MREFRALIVIERKRGSVLFFRVPDWDNGEALFSTEVSHDIANKLEAGHRCFAKYVLSSDGHISGFKDWEIVKQMTDEDMQHMFGKTI